MHETKMKSAQRPRVKTFYANNIANTKHAVLAVCQLQSRRGRLPPYLEVKVRGPLEPWCRWTHSLRDCGDDLVALLADLLGYDIGEYAFVGNESVRGVCKDGCVILYFGDGQFTCAILDESALELLEVLARLFGWDLTDDDS